jgi:integrase
MADICSSIPPGRYELFTGSGGGFRVTVLRPVQDRTGTKDSLLDGASQDTLSDRGQRTTSQGGSLARKRYQTGCVFLRGKNQVWIGRYREDIIGANGKVFRKRTSIVLGSKKEFPTKRLAERRMEQLLARVNAIGYRPGRIATLGEFIERWKTEVLSKQEPSSARAVKSHLKCYITPHLSTLRLDQFGVENQQSFVTRVSEAGVSRKTTLNILGTLSSMLDTAKDWGYTCEQIDVSKLALPKRGLKYEAPRFTLEQLRLILAAACNPWRTLFYILTLNGLRAGEVLGLKWDDIDLDLGLIKVSRSAWYGQIKTAKSQASETVLPIPEALAEVLRVYRSEWKPNPRGFLFVTRNNRPPSSNKVVEYRLWPILDKLGIPRCGLHAFRHTHTSLLLEGGATPAVAQRQLRHSDARTTLGIYGHVVGNAHREAVEKVASILDPVGPKLKPVTQLIQ